MAARFRWTVDLHHKLAASEAGTVRFCRVGQDHQILSIRLKKDFAGAHVRLCHDALQAIRVAEYNSRLEAVCRLNEPLPSHF